MNRREKENKNLSSVRQSGTTQARFVTTVFRTLPPPTHKWCLDKIAGSTRTISTAPWSTSEHSRAPHSSGLLRHVTWCGGWIRKVKNQCICDWPDMVLQGDPFTSPPEMSVQDANTFCKIRVLTNNLGVDFVVPPCSFHEMFVPTIFFNPTRPQQTSDSTMLFALGQRPAQCCATSRFRCCGFESVPRESVKDHPATQGCDAAQQRQDASYDRRPV